MLFFFLSPYFLLSQPTEPQLIGIQRIAVERDRRAPERNLVRHRYRAGVPAAPVHVQAFSGAKCIRRNRGGEITLVCAIERQRSGRCFPIQ